MGAARSARTPEQPAWRSTGSRVNSSSAPIAAAGRAYPDLAAQPPEQAARARAWSGNDGHECLRTPPRPAPTDFQEPASPTVPSYIHAESASRICVLGREFDDTCPTHVIIAVTDVQIKKDRDKRKCPAPAKVISVFTCPFVLHPGWRRKLLSLRGIGQIAQAFRHNVNFLVHSLAHRRSAGARHNR